MTQEENERRKNDDKVNFIKDHLCDKSKDKKFVFISYKSDEWEIVLSDIVYRLITEHGLNVYFDGSFDKHNDSWYKQFPKNMKSYNCAGVLCFISNKYTTSYATLLELMYSQSTKGKKRKVVPINLEKLEAIYNKKEGEEDTGLGVKEYKDGSINKNATKEQDLFNTTFDDLIYQDDIKLIGKQNDIIFRESRNLYNKVNLTKGDCQRMMLDILEFVGVNDNDYITDMDLDDIVDSIKDAFGGEVFGDPIPDPDKDGKKETNPKVKVLSKEETKPDNPNTGTSVGDTKPDPEPDGNGNGDVYYYYKAAGGYSVVKKNALGKYCILKGSKWSPKEKAHNQQKRDELVKEHVVENGVFKQDYPANSSSLAAGLISGNSTSGPAAFTDERIVTKEQAEKIHAELNKNTNQTTSDAGTDYNSNSDGNTSEASLPPVPPVPPVEPQPVDIYYHYKAAGGHSVVKKNALGKYCILKGSKWSPKEKAHNQQKRDELVKEHVVENGVFKQDYVANSPSLVAGLISGSSTSGPRAFTDEKIVTKEQAERILVGLQNTDNEPAVSNAEEKASGNNSIQPNRLI